MTKEACLIVLTDSEGNNLFFIFNRFFVQECLLVENILIEQTVSCYSVCILTYWLFDFEGVCLLYWLYWMSEESTKVPILGNVCLLKSVT